MKDVQSLLNHLVAGVRKEIEAGERTLALLAHQQRAAIARDHTGLSEATRDLARPVREGQPGRDRLGEDARDGEHGEEAQGARKADEAGERAYPGETESGRLRELIPRRPVMSP